MDDIVKELQEIKRSYDQVIGELISLRGRLENIEGSLDHFDTLLTNHITDYIAKFKALRERVELFIKATGKEMNAYSRSFRMVVAFAVISLAGFVTLAILLTVRFIGG